MKRRITQRTLRDSRRVHPVSVPTTVPIVPTKHRRGGGRRTIAHGVDAPAPSKGIRMFPSFANPQPPEWILESPRLFKPPTGIGVIRIATTVTPAASL